MPGREQKASCRLRGPSALPPRPWPTCSCVPVDPNRTPMNSSRLPAGRISKTTWAAKSQSGRCNEQRIVAARRLGRWQAAEPGGLASLWVQPMGEHWIMHPINQ